MSMGEQGNDNIIQDQIKATERINQKTATMQKWQDLYQKKQEIQLEKSEKLSKIREERTTKRILLDDRLQKQRRILEAGTRMGSAVGGGVGGSIFGFMQQIASMKVLDYSQKKDDAKDLDKDFKDAGAVSGLRAKPEKTFLGKIDKQIDRAFGKGSKWDKMFGGHGRMAAMGAGMGAAGAGIAMTKAIIDSSAMLQQMLKLLKFGFMLILKPIGDFFGFLMRPILILMLRKFIIPFYQKVYPWFITQGAKLGDNIAKVLDALTNEGAIVVAIGAVAAAVGIVIGGLKLFTGFTDELMTKLANRIGLAVANKGTIPINPTGTGTGTGTTGTGTNSSTNKTAMPNANDKFQGNQNKNPDAKTTGNPNWRDGNKNIHSGTPNDKNQSKLDKIMKRLAATFNKSPLKALQQLPNLIGQFGKTNIGNAMNNIKVGGLGGGVMRGLAGMLSGGGGGGGLAFALAPLLDNIPFMRELKEQFRQGLWGATGGQGFDGSGLDQWILDNIPQIGAANGFNGIIKKPTMFLAGEKGSEHIQVTPHGQQSGGGTTVNISIGNMSGNANDLNKLRSTILEVMQTVNVNRGR